LCERDAEYHLALSRTLKGEPLARALETQALYALVDADNRAALEEILDLRGEDRPLLPKVERITELKALRKAVEHALANIEVDFDKQVFVERLLGSAASINLRSSLLNEAANFSSVQWQESDIQLQKEWIDLQRIYGHSVKALYQAIACGEIANLDDQGDADAAAIRFNCPLLALIPRLKDAHKGKRTPEEAEQVLHQALELEPEAPGLWNRLGILLIAHLSCQDEAETAYRRAIDLHPKFAAPWCNLGLVLQYYLHRFKEAEAAYRKVIELEPKDARPWFNLGLLLQNHLHRFEDAEAAYRKAIELNPKDALPWNNLGLLLQIHLHRFEDAEAAYRHAIEIDPNNAASWNNLAWVLYHQMNQLSEAVDATCKAATLEPKNTYFIYTAATILLAAGKKDEAIIYCRHLFEKADDVFVQTIWDDFLLLFHEGLKAGTGAQLLQALDDSGAGERWRPLREALAAAVAGKAEMLLDVAPEVRKPALEILAIIAPDLSIPAALR
jgi:Flp pilus assembly protein TadD